MPVSPVQTPNLEKSATFRDLSIFLENDGEQLSVRTEEVAGSEIKLQDEQFEISKAIPSSQPP